MVTILSPEIQKYQSLPAGMMLCMVGGSIDADSFLLHGHVFAGLQTGNLVILGANLTNLTSAQIINYVFALIAFVVGIALVRSCQKIFRRSGLPKVMLGIEWVLLLAVSVFSKDLNNYCLVGLMSLAGAIQLQEFQLVHHQSFTSLMMMGHIKKTIDFSFSEKWSRVIANGLTLLSFVIGAIITGVLLKVWGDLALSFALVILLLLIGLPNQVMTNLQN